MRQQLGKLDLLILYELGYVPASKAGAELLFDVIATAYERNSLIVTTNLPFENWTEVLGSERLNGVALDRLEVTDVDQFTSLRHEFLAIVRLSATTTNQLVVKDQLHVRLETGHRHEEPFTLADGWASNRARHGAP
jgi:hypothetical protein